MLLPPLRSSMGMVARPIRSLPQVKIWPSSLTATTWSRPAETWTSLPVSLVLGMFLSLLLGKVPHSYTLPFLSSPTEKELPTVISWTLPCSWEGTLSMPNPGATLAWVTSW